jgi:hypothetical protein
MSMLSSMSNTSSSSALTISFIDYRQIVTLLVRI